MTEGLFERFPATGRRSLPRHRLRLRRHDAATRHARRAGRIRARHRLVAPLHRRRAPRGGRGRLRERRLRGRRRADRGVGADVRLRVLAHGDAVLRAARRGDARDPRGARPGRRAAQGLLAAQGREPDLGGDRAGRPALPLAPRGLRGRHVRSRAVLARQPRDHARHPAGRRVRGDRAAPERLRLLPRRGHGRGARGDARDRARRRADPPQRGARRAPAPRDRRRARGALRRAGSSPTARWSGARPSGSSRRRTPARRRT